MKSGRVIVAWAFLLISATLALAQNPVPFVNQPLVPTSAVPGGAGFTLTVNGTGFVSGATVNWNGAALITTFVSSSQLTATVPAANIATAGTAAVTVFNPTPGGGLSNLQYFQIVTPVTSLTFTGVGSGSIGGVSWVSGDFNGDGKVDLAGFRQSDSSICVQLGQGNGSFQSSVCSSAGSSPLLPTLIAGDFNGDGKLDLAVTGSTSSQTPISQVVIFLGNGDGTFSAAKNSVTGLGAVSIVAGDFNGDGKLDLATGNQGDANHVGSVSILLGNGDGTFQPPVDYATTFVVEAIAVGDFNGDGKLDLSFFDQQGSSVSLLVGNGDGTFQAGTTLTNFAGTSLHTADLNGDGKLDLIGWGVNGSNIALGNGDGTFQPATTLGGQAVADVNGDGDLDLLTLNVDSSVGTVSLSISLGNGDGTFQPVLTIPVTGLDASAFTTADFNNDGRADLAVSFGSSFSVLLQGSFPIASPFPSSLAIPGLQFPGDVSQPQPVTLTNVGTGTMTLSGNQITGQNASEFTVNSSTCGSTLAANASCQINVVFAPKAGGSRTATLSIGDNALGSPQLLPLSGNSQDFSMTASPSSATVSPGQTADYTLTLGAIGGYNHDVNLTCSGAPAGSICTVPERVDPPNAVNVAIQTAGGSANLKHPGVSSRTGGRLAAWFALSGISGLLVVSSAGGRLRERRERLFCLLVFFSLLSICVSLPACSGGSSTGGGGGGTPAGTYNVTITGMLPGGTLTGGTLSHTTILTLVVQ